MKNKSVIEHYQDDVCIIPAEIKSMQTKEILAQIKQIQADKCGTKLQINYYIASTTWKEMKFFQRQRKSILQKVKTALGQLMVDMQQSDSAKISNKVLADRMKQLKQGKEFVTMCKEIERFENEVTVKVASEERINAVKTLLSCGLDDKTITAKMAVQYNIPEEEVRTYIAKARGN